MFNTMRVDRTRTYLELRVGEHAIVQVVLHLRREDLEWFNKDIKDDNTNEVGKDDLHVQPRWPELYSLLETQALPRLFEDEVEDAYWTTKKRKGRQSSSRPPALLGPGGIAIDTHQPKKPLANKRRKLTKKQQKEMQKQQSEEEKEKKRAQKEFFHALGDTMQLSYKVEPITDYGTTLVLTGRGNKEQEKDEKQYKALETLSKRLLVWCYPVNDETNVDQPDPPGGGFLRPEYDERWF